MWVLAPEDIRLVEPVPIEDDLCSELALIEEVPLGARFVLISRQTCYESGSVICAVRRKIVLPFAAIPKGIELAARFMTRRALTRSGLRLVT